MFLPQTILKIRSESSKSFIQFNISYVILKSYICNLYVIRMSILCTRMPLVCRSHVTRVCSYVIRMSLLCVCKSSVYTRMSSVCHSYVLVCHSHVTRMYSYVNLMSLVCTFMLSVCHSYAFVCHPYVTRMYSYVIRMSLVCTCMTSACHWYKVLPWAIHITVYMLESIMKSFFNVCRNKNTSRRQKLTNIK